MERDELKLDFVFVGGLILFFYGLYKVGQVSSNQDQETVPMGIRG